jgi:hypothetical protein
MQGYRRTLDHMSLDYVPIGLDADSNRGWFGLNAKAWFGPGKTMSLNIFSCCPIIHHPALDFESIEFNIDTINSDIINCFPKDDKLKL